MKIELPPSEIDRGNVKKSAYTNLIRNGITRLLGIRNLTYEEIREFAGITTEQITRFKYKTNGKSNYGSTSSTGQNKGANTATQSQMRMIHKIFADAGIKEEMKHQVATDLLEKEITSMKDLTMKDTSDLILKINELKKGA